MNEAETRDIPPTEPKRVRTKASNEYVGTPAVVTPAPPKIESKTKISGSALVPNAGDYASVGTTQYFYWVGVLPSCPNEYIIVAGINFPKINENLIPDPQRTGQKKRVPVIGAIVPLTEDKIEMMIDRLPRTVIRFSAASEAKEEPGTGQNLGDVHERPRKGRLIRIPSEEELAARKETRGNSMPYIRQANDEPAARYMFAVLCANQDKPDRGDYYPEVLENTGLEWPDKIEG